MRVKVSFRMQRVCQAIWSAALLSLACAGAVQAQTKIRFTLDWIPGSTHASFLIALQSGYYKAEGLDVSVDRGKGSAEVVRQLASRLDERDDAVPQECGNYERRLERVGGIGAGVSVLQVADVPYDLLTVFCEKTRGAGDKQFLGISALASVPSDLFTVNPVFSLKSTVRAGPERREI